MKHQNRAIRIIGGKWRGRKVRFPNNDAIRPTTDRIRETLFNWLMHDVAGTTCLDLYAGSGALGIEALSRGAQHLTFVEKDEPTADQLRDTLDALECSDYNLQRSSALDYLRHCKTAFDIIFLDPPFDSNELGQALALIGSRNLAAEYVYIETNLEPEPFLPEGWTVHRKKQAGAVFFCLVDLRAAASV